MILEARGYRDTQASVTVSLGEGSIVPQGSTRSKERMGAQRRGTAGGSKGMKHKVKGKEQQEMMLLNGPGVLC